MERHGTKGLSGTTGPFSPSNTNYPRIYFLLTRSIRQQPPPCVDLFSKGGGLLTAPENLIPQRHARTYAPPVAEPASPARGRTAIACSSIVPEWCPKQPPDESPLPRKFQPLRLARATGSHA